MHTDTELTTTEVARRKGVTPQAVTAAIRSGKLPARIHRQPGAARGTWLIRSNDLEAWHPVTDRAERLERAHAARWNADEAEARHRAAARAGQGSRKHDKGPHLEDFLREKRQDLEREEYRPCRSAADA